MLTMLHFYSFFFTYELPINIINAPFLLHCLFLQCANGQFCNRSNISQIT